MVARSAPLSIGHEVDLLLAAELLGSAADRVCPIRDAPGLHVCPACQRPFVLPGAVHAVMGAAQIRLDLACANCDWSTTAVHADHELAALDQQLDRSFADLLWTLEVVWSANEHAAIERFVVALEAGAILPEDF